MRGSALLICGCVVLPLALSGCDSLKRSVGLEKVVPNEFDVVENAPLAIPPDFNLRPPRPGAQPTQGLTPTAQAKETIFRAGGDKGPIGGDTAMSTGETDILRAAGAQNTQGDIRAVVNQEATESQPFNKGFVDDLVFWRSNKKPDTKGLLDPVKETARLADKQAAAQATVSKQFAAPPTIDRKSDSQSVLDKIF